MTPWRWWAGSVGENEFNIACDCATRDEAIREACRNIAPGDQFVIVEARQSEAAKYEGADFVPFLRVRNQETLTVGPTP